MKVVFPGFLTEVSSEFFTLLLPGVVLPVLADTSFFSLLSANVEEDKNKGCSWGYRGIVWQVQEETYWPKCLRTSFYLP